MPFDNLCKYLSEKYPERFVTWLLGQPLAPVEVLKTELSIEPIRADFVTFLRTQDRVLHLEFQVEVATDPPLPLRMLDYWVRLHRRYRLPVTQILVLLKPPSSNALIKDHFQLEETQHRYRVMRLWEQDPEQLLQDVALLPLAVLAATETPSQLLGQVAEQVSKIEETNQRQEVGTCAQILAGLRFEESLIRQVFKEGLMRESVIYQEIIREGKQEEARALITRQLARQIGIMSAELQVQIRGLSTTQLENLGEALLDFSDITDLAAWLQTQIKP